jgi:AraC family transcriptional regulator
MTEHQGEHGQAPRGFDRAPPPPEWREANPNAVTTGRWARDWRHVSAAVNEMSFTGPFEVDRTFAADRLIVILDEAGDRLHGRTSGRPAGPVPDAPHRLYYMPAGAPLWTFARNLESLRFLSLQFAREDLQALGEDVSALPDTPRMGFFDPPLLVLARLFEAECGALTSSEPLLGDSLALRLLALLSKAGPEPKADAARGGLTDRQIHLVREYIESRLGEAVDLVDLAGVVGLSPSHFHRAFRVSMGAPPHRWLTERRIQRAQELMLNRMNSLADIAAETGFADQPHFTRVFSRAVGASPGAWRRTVVE